MFRKNATFVIGAGASAEFGLRVGAELAKRIKARSACLVAENSLIRPVDNFLHELLARQFGRGQYRDALIALQAIHEGIRTAVSIDAFIDRFKRAELVPILGKLLIALEIAEAERGCLMHPHQIASPDTGWETANR